MAYKLSLFDRTKQRRHRDTFVCCPITQPEDHAEESRLERAEQDRRYGEAVILRLPAEIMAEIFKYSQLISNKHSADIDDLYKDLDWCWITLTHICRYWRDIAVNTQELWGYMDISQHIGIMQTKVYLERSGDSPLYVLYNEYSNYGSNAESLGLLAHHIHRVRLLHIRAIDYSEGVLAITMKAAPKLEEFSLILDTYDEMVDMQGLFAGKAPKLTSLSLGIRPMTWDNVPFMQNLRCLYISDSTDTLNNIEELLTVISQIRSCEQLSIRSLLAFQEPDNSVDLLQHQKQIRAPSLKYLEILDALYISLSRLFDCVEFPAIIGWNIFCRRFPYGAHERSDHKVISHISGNDQTSLSLKIVIAGDSVSIVANTKTAPVDVSQHQHCVTDLSDRKLELLRGSFSIRDGLALASSAIEGDFWCAATELELDVSRSLSDDMSLEENSWKHLLTLFPHLRTLTVWDAWSRYPSHGRVRFSCKETHHSLLSALGSPPDNIASNTVICPNLSELCLYGIDLWDYDKANHIIHFLEYRKDCGKQLDLLRVTGLDELSEEHVCVLLDSGVARVIEVMSS